MLHYFDLLWIRCGLVVNLSQQIHNILTCSDIVVDLLLQNIAINVYVCLSVCLYLSLCLVACLTNHTHVKISRNFPHVTIHFFGISLFIPDNVA